MGDGQGGDGPMMRWAASVAGLVSLLGLAIAGTWVPAVRGDEVATVVSSEEASELLSEAIDVIVAEAAVGPLAEACSDADFVRRVHLDLVGAIPTPAAVRAFLTDDSENRRERLVDELMASRAFVRQMARVLDAMLLERTTPPGGLAEPWQAWLCDSIAEARPLDELLGDVVAAEGGDPAVVPAAAFLLAREAEPVKMTRAVGRILFGRDLQCAQCHDHPLDDDIRQAEFHGLHAFVSRTSLFTAGKAPQLSEAAVGEVDFTSVFTDDSVKGAWPQLPDGPPLIEEPVVEPGDGYQTTPSKASRGVPDYSRRSALASRLAESDVFRRNVANRIWAVFFGRGLVHPLDGLGPENPASHPRLLNRLVEALVAQDYHLRPLVRGIVLSRAYQRSVEPPAPEWIDPVAIEQTIASLHARQAELTSQLAELQRMAQAAESQRQMAFDAERAIHAELQPTLGARGEARKSANEATTAAAAAEAAREQAATVAEAVAKALEEARHASTLLAGDAEVTGVVSALDAQQQTRQQTLDAAATAATEKAAAKSVADEKLAAARAAFDEIAARRAPAALAELTRAADEAKRAFVACTQQLERVAWRLELAGDLLKVKHAFDADPLAAEVLWEGIVERLNENLQIASLRPLSPDQFALSLLQATGALARLEAAAAQAVDAKPPASVTEAPEPEKATAREKAIEQEFAKQAGSLLGSFASLYADPLVEGFQATLNQALYLGNASQVSKELEPTGDNLAARLLTTEDAGAAADEVCLAVLSRPATEEEREDIALFFTEQAETRGQAVAELIWAMLSSNEFRFNH